MPNKTQAAERRAALRTDTSINAIAKTSQGARLAVEISDLSAEGCGVRTSRHPLKAGLAYGLKIEGLETLGATTAWVAGESAGLQFERALHPAVADHLARLNPPVEETAEDLPKAAGAG